MKIKFRAKKDCINDWCKKHYGFYLRLIISSYPNISTDSLIKKYYNNYGVVLDKDFVIGMLKSLPEDCAKQLPNGKWDVSILPIFELSQKKR